MKYTFDTKNFKMRIKGLDAYEKSTIETAKNSIVGEEVGNNRSEKRVFTIEFITHAFKTRHDFHFDDRTNRISFTAYSEEEAIEKLYWRYSELHSSRIEIVSITGRPLVRNFWFAC